MEYLPVCLKLADARVALIGGGQVALRKARLLVRAGAQVSVIAPSIDPDLEALLRGGGHTLVEQAYAPELLDGCRLVIAATPDAAVNRQVSDDAQALNLPVNVVDQPDLCTFIFPSIVDRDPLVIAISSSGRSPVLTRIIRRKLETLFPPGYGALARFAGRFRDQVKSRIGDERLRRQFWEDTLESDIAQQVLAGHETRAAELLEARMEQPAVRAGQVALVGAGPGDPELLTLKALRVLQQADVVLYDRLVADAIVDLARRDARRIYVGKRRAEHSVPQPQINTLLLELAQSGERVVRLKGGDPFIFGRGGEEIELLTKHQVPFEVIPGVTAANGASCYAGIPLTHRDYAQSVRFVAGYLKGDSVSHDWSQFQSSTETLVFYMGLVGLPQICEGLMAHGRSPETPVALVEQGTEPSQRVLVGTLATMPGIVEREKPAAPTLIIVGEVVRLHDQLTWFNGRAGGQVAQG
jgi:uroporphyrin-III C-methyltransferase/precorrin-2 dehydrogenase/sirohydrochlorin ferrochelatase